MPKSELIFISLGSNIEPLKHLLSARDYFYDRLQDARISPIYQSAAVGMEGADFLNAVVTGYTTETLGDCITGLNQLEQRHGRVRTKNKFSDRTLDLDLLLFGDLIVTPDADNSLRLPHPEILDQAYVIKPLADIAGETIHPECNQTMAELCTHLMISSPGKFQSLKIISDND